MDEVTQENVENVTEEAIPGSHTFVKQAVAGTVIVALAVFGIRAIARSLKQDNEDEADEAEVVELIKNDPTK